MKKKRVVIKIGTAVLTKAKAKSDVKLIEKSRISSASLDFSNFGVINTNVIRKLVDSSVKLLKMGAEVIIVSSGAIGTGLRAGLKAGLDRKELFEHSLRHKQALASIGQAQLVNIYNKYFGEYNRLVAQVLLSREDLVKHQYRYINARHTIEALLKLGVVPVINENDTVAIEELKIGDNDILSALVAIKLKADVLVILTDVDGFYTVDSHVEKKMKLMREVKNIIPGLKKHAGGTGSYFGTGGMASKLQAVKMTTAKGIVSYIANGNRKDVLLRILQGKDKDAGTKFLPKKKRK